MLALQITSLKPFMNALLTGELFDSFLLEEAVIAAAATYSIDGRLNKAFFSSEEWEQRDLPDGEFALWRDMRSLCFQLIKGKRTPLHFKFVFQLPQKAAASIMEKGGATASMDFIKALVLTVRYDGEKAVLLTGTSYTTFLTDKEPERLWDAACKQYLTKKEIAYKEL